MIRETALYGNSLVNSCSLISHWAKNDPKNCQVRQFSCAYLPKLGVYCRSRIVKICHNLQWTQEEDAQKYNYQTKIHAHNWKDKWDARKYLRERVNWPTVDSRQLARPLTICSSPSLRNVHCTLYKLMLYTNFEQWVTNKDALLTCSP